MVTGEKWGVTERVQRDVGRVVIEKTPRGHFRKLSFTLSV